MSSRRPSAPYGRGAHRARASSSVMRYMPRGPGSAGERRGDDEFAAWLEPGEQQRAVEDRVMGGDDDVACAVTVCPASVVTRQGSPSCRPDRRGSARRSRRRWRDQVLGERQQVLAGVELRLVRPPGPRPRRRRADRCPRCTARGDRPRAAASASARSPAVPLLADRVGVRRGALQIAVDAQHRRDLGRRARPRPAATWRTAGRPPRRACGAGGRRRGCAARTPWPWCSR